jgi:thioredoxin-dependent peroxiredoxin
MHPALSGVAPDQHAGMRIQAFFVVLVLCSSARWAAAAEVLERTDLVHGKDGAPLTLVGPALLVGMPAPPVTLRDAGLQPVSLGWTDGKIRIVTSAPSLDTPTCSKQAHAFSARAAELGSRVEVVFVSRDLPFAQKRFCAAEGISGIRVLSDYVDGGFARSWGLYIKEVALDARSAWVIDGGGMVRYGQIVANLPSEPDYDAVIAAVQALLAPAP